MKHLNNKSKNKLMNANDCPLGCRKKFPKVKLKTEISIEQEQ